MSRLMNVAIRFQRVFAILALVLVFNFTAAAAVNDFVSFKVNCNGVLGDVVAKGYSPLVVGYAVDKDGNELAPSEFETYSGATLRVPKSVLDGKKPANLKQAREKWAAIAAAHEARVKAIGKKKYEAAVKQCETELAPPAPAPKFKSFNINPAKLNLKVGETGKFKANVLFTDNSVHSFRSYMADTNKLSVKVADGTNDTLEVKGLVAGDHKVTLVSGDHKEDVLVHVEDYSFGEKLSNFFSDNWVLLTGIGLLVLLLVGLLIWRRRRSAEPDLIHEPESSDYEQAGDPTPLPNDEPVEPVVPRGRQRRAS